LIAFAFKLQHPAGDFSLGSIAAVTTIWGAVILDPNRHVAMPTTIGSVVDRRAQIRRSGGHLVLSFDSARYASSARLRRAAGCSEAEHQEQFALPPGRVVDQACDEHGGEFSLGVLWQVGVIDRVEAAGDHGQ
jgi:hypothetical protein